MYKTPTSPLVNRAESNEGLSREPEVLSALNNLATSVEKANELLQRLNGRLSPVLQPSPPEAVSPNEKVISNYNAPIAQNIEGSTRKIAQLCIHMDRLLSALEV